MQAALLVIILIQLACGNILDTFKHLFSANELKSVVQKIVHAVGTDATEHACEGACHAALRGHLILVHSCPLVCKSEGSNHIVYLLSQQEDSRSLSICSIFVKT